MLLSTQLTITFRKNVWVPFRRHETPYYCYSATKLSARSFILSSSVALQTLINHFDQRGVGRIVGLVAKLMDAQGQTKSIEAFLQRMLNNYLDINKDEFMVSEKILVGPTLFFLNIKSLRVPCQSHIPGAQKKQQQVIKGTS
jgi:hypothetical protein